MKRHPFLFSYSTYTAQWTKQSKLPKSTNYLISPKELKESIFFESITNFFGIRKRLRQFLKNVVIVQTSRVDIEYLVLNNESKSNLNLAHIVNLR